MMLLIVPILAVTVGMTFAADPVSQDGKCGVANGRATCLASQFGNCCSSMNWCGITEAHCEQGCQTEFGTCKTPAKDTTSSVTIPASSSQDSSGATPVPSASTSPLSTAVPPPPAPSASTSPRPLAVPPTSAAIVDTRFPNLIIPLDSANPNAAGGTQFSGTVFKGPSQEIAIEIVFDNVPQIDASCRFNFFFGKNGPWAISGDIPWTFDIFEVIGGFAGLTDSWNHHPVFGRRIAGVVVNDGMITSLSDHSVACNTKVQVVLRASRNLNLTWFELTDPKQGFVLEMLK